MQIEFQNAPLQFLTLKWKIASNLILQLTESNEQKTQNKIEIETRTLATVTYRKTEKSTTVHATEQKICISHALIHNVLIS